MNILHNRPTTVDLYF